MTAFAPIALFLSSLWLGFRRPSLNRNTPDRVERGRNKSRLLNQVFRGPCDLRTELGSNTLFALPHLRITAAPSLMRRSSRTSEKDNRRHSATRKEFISRSALGSSIGWPLPEREGHRNKYSPAGG